MLLISVITFWRFPWVYFNKLDLDDIRMCTGVGSGFRCVKEYAHKLQRNLPLFDLIKDNSVYERPYLIRSRHIRCLEFSCLFIYSEDSKGVSRKTKLRMIPVFMTLIRKFTVSYVLNEKYVFLERERKREKEERERNGERQKT